MNLMKRIAVGDKEALEKLYLLYKIVSVPVAAHIPYISERMQTLSNKEIQNLSDMTQQQMTELDLFSRPLSREERIRMEAVRQEYENGIFPKGEILIVSGDEQIDIDYYYKRDYSLQTQEQEMAANPGIHKKDSGREPHIQPRSYI